MKVEDLAIPEVKLIHPGIFRDSRGFFQQTYHRRMYADAGIEAVFTQDNWSRSGYGVLRGLHYQLENPQVKLVSVLRGEVFDVAVDIRRGSPSFGKWVGTVLSDRNHVQKYVPAGFAHGFAVLSKTADVVYKCDGFHAPGDEYAIAWNDVDIGIEWPELTQGPELSSRDAAAPSFKEIPTGNLPVFGDKQ